MEENNINDAEERREVIKAALLLCSWKYLKLDPVAARVLEKQKKEILEHRTRIQHPPVASHGHQPMPMQIGQPDNNEPAAGDNNDRAIRFPPVLALNGLIGECSRPFEKPLTESDVKDDQSRLSLNKDFVINYFLPILKEGEDPEEGITATTYDIQGKEYEEMVFKLWGKKMYVLTRNWKQFCHDHDFVKHDWVTVWMFRHNQTNKLCFAITSRRVVGAEESPQRNLRSTAGGSGKRNNGRSQQQALQMRG